MYDGHSDPKQFLMSYEATISSYGGNAAVMAKSFSSARDHYFVVEAQGYAGDKFPRLPNEASHSSGLVSMHVRS
jgi:hypothetical protein